MPTFAITLLVVGTVVTVVAVAVVALVLVDRVHAVVAHVLAVRDQVLPIVEELRSDLEGARRRAAALQASTRPQDDDRPD